MTVKGADLSHWNVFPKLTGFDFVILKATQSSTFLDPTLADRRTAVRKANKVLGLYMFVVPSLRPDLQVEWFARHADVQPGDIVALDFEDDDNWERYSRLTLAVLARDTMNLLMQKFPDNRVVLYCNRDTWTTIVKPYSVPLGDGLWIASPQSAPPMPWTFWQYGQSGIDLNYGNFTDVDQLRQWAQKEDDMGSWNDELTVEAPSSRWREPGKPAYTETHSAAFILGDAYFYSSGAFWNTEQLKATNAAVLAAVAEGDLDADRIMERVDTTLRESVQAGIAQQVLPAIRDAVAAVLGDDKAEVADAIVRELIERLQAKGSPSPSA